MKKAFEKKSYAQRGARTHDPEIKPGCIHVVAT